MKRYDEKILNALLDKYENSLLYTGENKRSQTIGFPVKKNTLPEYFDETSGQYAVIHEQLQELQEKGLVRLVWKGKKEGHILEKCVLVTETAEDAYQWLHRLPKKQKEAQVLNICHEYAGRHPVLDSFLQYITRRLEQGESVDQYVNLDNPGELSERCRLVLEILNNREEIFLREFSIRYRNDSKAVEKEIAGAAGLIARFSGNGEWCGLNAEQVLEECSIYKNPAWVMVKGCGRFWKGEKGASQVWLEDWTGGIGLSSRDIVSVRWDVDTCPARIVTIENLTSFHRWQEDNTLAIYLGGYHNRVKRKFLQQVYEAYPKAVYLHFGDMDCGGFLIWKDLCEKTGIPFLPWRMDLDTYLRYAEYGKELTDYDRRELRKMGQDPFFAGQRGLFAMMLERGRKVEQECVRSLNWRGAGAGELDGML